MMQMMMEATTWAWLTVQMLGTVMVLILEDILEIGAHLMHMIDII